MTPNSKWWKKRTDMERYLTIIIIVISCIGILLIAILATVISKKSAEIASEEHNNVSIDALDHKRITDNICETPGCIHTASKLLESIDESVDPCDDFYEFTCGRFLKNNHIPDDKSAVTSITKIGDELKEKLRALIEKPILPNESKPFQLTKKLYRACMNQTLIEAKGLPYMQSILKELGGWPILEAENWKESEFNWFTSVYKFRRHGMGTGFFMSFSVETDVRNSTRRRIILDEAGLGLRREFLINGSKDNMVKEYYNYMVDIAVLFGAQKDKALEELRKSLEFEIELAKISLPVEERRNVTALYNPMTLFELQQKFPSIPWLEYINNLLAPDTRVENDEVANVRVPKYFSDFEALIAKTPKRVQANYAMRRAVVDSVFFLNEALRKRELEYLTIIAGMTERETRWKECINVIADRMPITTGALYVRKYFNENARKYVKEIVADIRVEFEDILKTVDWMDNQTRQNALDKAKSLSTHIAYPDELLNDKKIEELYEGLELDAENFLGSVLNLSLFDARFAFKRLQQPVNKSDWIDHGAIAYVNAYYSGPENSIQLTAGILQGAFFNAERPKYMNYGGIGYAIGHEITHGFDDEGKQYNKDGILLDWWKPETEKAFTKKAQCIIDQYGNYTVPEVNMKINGINTQGENIADNGGIKQAYLAYKRWIARNGEEPRLPGLKYNGRQMFWISVANVWCSLIRNESLQQSLVADVHAPDKYRIVVPLSNMEYFSDDFKCPKGSKMNPKHKCKVW